ncbi:MAG: hypothetical protein MEEGG_02943 [Eggerthella lenta]
MVSSSGAAVAFCTATIAEVLSGRTVPSAASDAPISSIVSVIICLSSVSTCAEMSGALNAAAIASFGLPRIPTALPTSFDQPWGKRVMSYTILGNATCLMHCTYIEYSLLIAI